MYSLSGVGGYYILNPNHHQSGKKISSSSSLSSVWPSVPTWLGDLLSLITPDLGPPSTILQYCVLCYIQLYVEVEFVADIVDKDVL